jgi:hypothetical protein
MESEQRPPITDSPWFYVLVFSLMALLALVVIGPKYGRRQSALERKYQARERIEDARQARNISGTNSRTDELAARRRFATPGDTLVPLWPLAAILVVVVLFAGYMLRRGRGVRQAQPSRRLATASSEQPGSLRHESSSP